MTEIRTRQNGDGGAMVPQDVQEPDRYEMEVQLGMARYLAACQERDQFRTKAHEQALQIERLGIQIEQAREAERIHIAKVVDEAVLSEKKFQTENSILRDENMALRSELTAAHAQIADIRAENVRMVARIELVRGALDQVLDGKDSAADRMK